MILIDDNFVLRDFVCSSLCHFIWLCLFLGFWKGWVFLVAASFFPLFYFLLHLPPAKEVRTVYLSNSIYVLSLTPRKYKKRHFGYKVISYLTIGRGRNKWCFKGKFLFFFYYVILLTTLIGKCRNIWNIWGNKYYPYCTTPLLYYSYCYRHYFLVGI